MTAAWPKVALGDILAERRETPSDIDLLSGEIRIVDKVSFNDGRIHLRQSQETKTEMILVRPGDILVSGINAAKGAIAIHDAKASTPLAATIHYSAYQADESRAYPKFLWWLLRSNFFRELLSRHVPGGIKTELKSKRLLPIPIALPPLGVQRLIVARIEELAAKVDEASRTRTLAVKELAALHQANTTACMESLNANGQLADVLTAAPRNGWSPSCDNLESGTPVLTLSAVTGWNFNSSGFKRTSQPKNPNAHYWAYNGDLLITRSNTPELVGHAAICNGLPSPTIYPDLMMKVPVDQNKASTRFVWYWLQSARARDFVRRSAKGTSPTMKKISQSVVQQVPFPANLALGEQDAIVRRIDTLRATEGTVAAIQAETAAELDAMLPAILDKAFKGEL
jgi:type I restriction enzyme S subunit